MTIPCSLPALQKIAEQLRGFGCNVHFDTPESGRVTHDAGALRFSHRDGHLTVEIVQDHAHFPRRLLIGGIRQVIEEAVEAL